MPKPAHRIRTEAEEPGPAETGSDRRMKIEGKKILITGAARRLGRTMIERLAEAGAEVAVHYRSSADEAESLRQQLTAQGTTAHLIQAELSSPEACEATIAEAIRRMGGLDVLVNNAALFQANTLMNFNLASAREQMMVNCWAPLLLSRALARQGNAGRIIHILDQRIAHPHGKQFSYTLSKKALAETIGMLALELAPRFTVNGVAPGAVLPPDERSGVHEKAGPAPLKHTGTPQDVAEALLFLIQAESITGQIIWVDGGQHLL